MSLWLSLIALTGLLGLSAPTASATEAAGPRKIRPANESATERRDLRAFDAVKVSHGIQLILSQADEYRVEVTADRNLLPLVRTDVSYGTLHISYPAGLRVSGSMGTTTVCVSMPHPELIAAETGASVLVEGALRGRELTLTTETGTSVTGSFLFDKLNVSVETGSILYLVQAKGRTLTLSAENGSDITGSVAFDNVTISAESGSSVRLDGTLNCSELQLDAENGSNISGAFRADRVSASADTASTIDMISLTCSTLTASADLSSEVIGTLRSCNEATLDASNCSTIDLRGNCRTLTAHASVYATLSLRRLNCERAELTATHMAIIDSTVHERLSATVASGGTVTYAGNPTLDEINTHKNGNFYRR